MPRRGKGLAARAREAGLPGAPAGMASRGPQDAPGIPAHMALLPHTHPQHRQRRRAPSNYLPDDASHFLQEKSQKADVIRGPLSM